MNDVRQLTRRFGSFVTLATAAFAVILSAASADAQCTDTWTGSGGDHNWSNGANWSNGKEPGTSDAVCIQKSGAAVNMDVSDGILNLTVGSGNSLTLPVVAFTNNSLAIGGTSVVNNGEIVIPYDKNTQTYTNFYLTSGGPVTLSGTGSVLVSAGSGISGAGPGGTLVNTSTIAGGGYIQNGMALNNAKTGVINANQPQAQFLVGRIGASTNKGLLEATNGGQLVMGSLALNNVGGTIKAAGKSSSVFLVGQGAGNETFTGGKWTTSGGGVIYCYDSGVLLDGTANNIVTISGTFQAIDGAPHPGCNFQGTVNNTGTIQLLSKGNQINAGIPGGQTWTLTGSGSLTLGDGTSNSYNNQVGISGNGAFVNQQLVQGTGYILNLPGFTNSGTINANVPAGTNNLQLQLGRAGSSTNTGTIEATNGGVLVMGSTTINNVGGTIAATGAGSAVVLVGSLGTSGLTIAGGTFDGSGGGVVYGQGDSVLDGTTSTVNNAGTMIINTQDLQAQGTLNNSGTIQILGPTNDNGQTFLQVPNGENLTLTGSGKVIMGDGTDNSYNNNAEIGSSLGTNGNFDNRSTIEGTGGIVRVNDVVNDGTIIANVPTGNSGLTMTIDRVGNIQNNGTIRATNRGVFYIGGGSCCGNPFANAGAVIADVNSTVNLQNANPFGNLANGVLTGGTYHVTGTLVIPGNIGTNAAKITLNGKASQILNPSSNALAAFVTNAPKGSFSITGGQGFTSAGTFTNQGAITIGKGSTFAVPAGSSYLQTGGKTTVDGTLTIAKAGESTEESDLNPAASLIHISRGLVFGNGGNIAAHLLSAGTLTPADSATKVGKLTVTGAYTQTAAGALDANIAGATSGQFNLLNVTATATLGGTLNIALLNKFVPAVGDTFEILTARTVTGTFAIVNGTKINDSEHFTVTYNSDNVTLTVVSGS
jgi:hypothetical protein